MKITATCCLYLLMMIGSIATAQQVVPPPSLCPRPCYYYLTFVSGQGVTTATSTNIATYNSFVTGVASNLNNLLSSAGVVWQGSPNTWYALGSTSTVNAVQNIPTQPYPIFNVQNPPGPFEVSVSPYAWLNLPLLVGENIGPDGNTYPNFGAWTGTNNTGGTATPYPLGNPIQVTQSNVTGGLTNWINTGTDGSGEEHEMYAISGLLCIGPGAACSSPCPIPAAVVASWAQFRFVPCHTGLNPYEFVLSPTTVAMGLVNAWPIISYQTQGDVSSSPAVANANCNNVPSSVVYVGSLDGNLYAVNASTGALCWSYPTGTIIYSSPAVANAVCNGVPTPVVYVGSEDGNVYALNASTSALCWKSPTTLGDFVESSPAVANGVVYVGSNDDNLYAFDASTGRQLWKGVTGALIRSSPAVANGMVYVGSHDGYFYAFNANGCKHTGICPAVWKWSDNTGAGFISSPAVGNAVCNNVLTPAVFVGSELGNVYALNAATGGPPCWTYPTPGVELDSPAVATELINGVQTPVVYVGAEVGVTGDNLYALNANTGAFIWSALKVVGVESSPAVANGVVYVGADDKNLYALDATTGAMLTYRTTFGIVDSSPAVANGVVYVGSRDGGLYAFTTFVLFSDLGPPANPYQCNTGWTIAGSNNGGQPESYTAANEFQVGKSGSVSEIDVAVGYLSGVNSFYVT
jgi:outer membrane protein assembly factor BamB